MPKRFEVVCKDGDGEDLVVGVTDDPTGGLLVDVVRRHPSWHSAQVLESKSKQVVMASLPDSWPFPTGM